MGTMKLLPVTILCLLSTLRRSDGNPVDGTATTPALSQSTVAATRTSVPTPTTTPSPSPTLKSTVTSPKGTPSPESFKTSPPTVSSLNTTVSGEAVVLLYLHSSTSTICSLQNIWIFLIACFRYLSSSSSGVTDWRKEATTSVTKGEFITTNTTVTSLPVSDAVSTLQSSHNKTENQNSTKTTERTGNTLPPDTSPSKTSKLPSITMPENVSQSQETGTENAKNASSSSTNPSYSSIILPVVITLIVVTLSVFVLVGLYRMCWKTDPGAPDNGNDQPQSDKESVKLLTVKTISHESGEHCAQGKTKN
ncbi:endomucin isoform X1 [Equus przewalskii]|uniref:Endomucin isoform X1 n=1 Tax=Equus przewalskii TaxID=9798 RepID=A0ABM4NUR6_EQUPR